VRAVFILGLTLALVRFLGITGAGVAVLITQTVIAIAILPGLLGVLRSKADKDQPSRRRETAGLLRGGAA